MKKSSILLAVWLAAVSGVMAAEGYMTDNVKLPKLEMAQNGLTFDLIEGYGDYRIVATHYRTDKKELRYVLANPTAYNALKTGTLPMPEGSKVVKIGWSVKEMGLFPAALEADAIQRVEYMVKDAKRFDHNGDHWGYARFVKKGATYESWKGDTAECIACHSIASQNDYLFTTFQHTFE
jgi:hypothetical protein